MSTTEAQRHYHRFDDAGFSARIVTEVTVDDATFMDVWVSDPEILAHPESDPLFYQWYDGVTSPLPLLVQGRLRYPTPDGDVLNTFMIL